MAKILAYTDLHLADQNPRSRTGSYKDDTLNKLAEIIQLANELGVDYLINGADTFDRKDARSVTHSLVNDTIRIMQRLNPRRRHVTCVGTHDVPTGRLDKLPRQPLGILEAAGVIEVWGEPKLKRNPAWKEGSSFVEMLPDDTLEDPDKNLVIHFVPARYNLDKGGEGDKYVYMSGYGPEANGNVTVITVAHGMITPPGRGFFDDYTPAENIAKKTGANIVFYGHPHTPDGIYKAGSQVTFIGPGAISRRDASPYNRERTPQVAYIETDPDDCMNYQIELMDIPCRPGKEVFADVIQDELDENESGARLNEFVHHLAGAKISDDAWGMETLVAEIKASSAPEPTKALAQEILEEVAE